MAYFYFFSLFKEEFKNNHHNNSLTARAMFISHALSGIIGIYYDFQV
jgi:hypothetical protein